MRFRANRSRSAARTGGRRAPYAVAVAFAGPVMLAASLLAACGGGASGPGDLLEGTFTLVRANGRPLPALVWDSTWVDDAGNEFDSEAFLQEGELELIDGGYTLELVVDVILNDMAFVQDEPVTESGSYTVDGGTIRLTSSAGASTTGTVDGDEVRISETSEDYGTFTLTFRR